MDSDCLSLLLGFSHKHNRFIHQKKQRRYRSPNSPDCPPLPLRRKRIFIDSSAVDNSLNLNVFVFLQFFRDKSGDPRLLFLRICPEYTGKLHVLFVPADFFHRLKRQKHSLKLYIRYCPDNPKLFPTDSNPVAHLAVIPFCILFIQKTYPSAFPQLLFVKASPADFRQRIEIMFIHSLDCHILMIPLREILLIICAHGIFRSLNLWNIKPAAKPVNLDRILHIVKCGIINHLICRPDIRNTKCRKQQPYIKRKYIQ